MNGLSALLATRWQFCLHNWQNGDNFVCIIGNNIAVSSALVTVTVLSPLLALMWTFSLHYWQQGDSFVCITGNKVTVLSSILAIWWRLFAFLATRWLCWLQYWQEPDSFVCIIGNNLTVMSALQYLVFLFTNKHTFYYLQLFFRKQTK